MADASEPSPSAEDSSVEKEELALAKDAVANSGFALRHVGAQFQGSKDVVLVAVANAGGALRYASEQLCDDKDVVLTAVKSDGLALSYASSALRDDFDVCLGAVESNPDALFFAGETARRHTEIVRTAVAQNGLSLQHASDVLRGNILVLKTAFEQNPMALQFADPVVFATDPGYLVSDALKRSADVILYVVQQLQKSRSEKSLRAFYRLAAKIHPKEAISSFPSQVILSERDVLVDHVLPANPSLFKDLPYACKQREEIVLAAVAHDSSMLKYAPGRLRRKQRVADAAAEDTAESQTA